MRLGIYYNIKSTTFLINIYILKKSKIEGVQPVPPRDHMGTSLRL